MHRFDVFRILLLVHLDGRQPFAARHADHRIRAAQDRRRSAQTPASILAAMRHRQHSHTAAALYLVALFDQQAGVGRAVFIVAGGGKGPGQCVDHDQPERHIKGFDGFNQRIQPFLFKHLHSLWNNVKICDAFFLVVKHPRFHPAPHPGHAFTGYV